MLRRPARSTRTDTLFPYTTLFLAARGTTTTRNGAGEHRDAPNVAYGPPTLRLACTVTPCWINDDAPLFCATIMIPAAAFELPFIALDMSKLPALAEAVPPSPPRPRSDERRVGKEWGSTCRCGWATYHLKTTDINTRVIYNNH